ncbi:MAG: N-acetylmuramoyl-L-alanine amidase [Oscillospiraceae bacterium]|nr:N-acetylmuramoyl-L-alanine amidase [Oscillospiraceae bacterium]
MPKVFLSPSTQEFNPYIGGGNEEYYMNLVADRMEPYLRASGITYVRNDPARGAAGAIADSNSAYYDVHLALHSNASPPNLAGRLRGIDIYYAPSSAESERLATIIANNFKSIYPLPDRVTARPTTTLGEVTRTRAVAVLCEIGYHDNPEDAAWIRNNLTPIAANLTESLCDYFGIPFVTPQAVRRGMVVTDGSTLHLRSMPSTNSRILAAIPNGATVTIYGTTGNWYVVSWNGQTGYVYSDFVVVG